MPQQSLKAVFDHLIKEIENKRIKTFKQSPDKNLQEVTVRIGQEQVNEMEEVIHKYMGEPILHPGQEIDDLNPMYTEALGALPTHFRHKDQPLYGQAAAPHYIFGVWMPFAGGATLKLFYLCIR